MVTTTRRYNVKKPLELFNPLPTKHKVCVLQPLLEKGIPIPRNLTRFLFNTCRMSVLVYSSSTLDNLREPRNQAIINARMRSLNGVKIIKKRE